MRAAAATHGAGGKMARVNNSSTPVHLNIIRVTNCLYKKGSYWLDLMGFMGISHGVTALGNSVRIYHRCSVVETRHDLIFRVYIYFYYMGSLKHKKLRLLNPRPWE